MLIEAIRYRLHCIYTLLTNPTQYQQEQAELKEAMATLGRYSKERREELEFWRMYHGLK